MAPTNLSARVERLERARGMPRSSDQQLLMPRINVTVLGDGSGPLIGYRAGEGASAVAVMRSAGESDAALHARALAISGGDRIVVVVKELRER